MIDARPPEFSKDPAFFLSDRISPSPTSSAANRDLCRLPAFASHTPELVSFVFSATGIVLRGMWLRTLHVHRPGEQRGEAGEVSVQAVGYYQLFPGVWIGVSLIIDTEGLNARSE